MTPRILMVWLVVGTTLGKSIVQNGLYMDRSNNTKSVMDHPMCSDSNSTCNSNTDGFVKKNVTGSSNSLFDTIRGVIHVVRNNQTLLKSLTSVNNSVGNIQKIHVKNKREINDKNKVIKLNISIDNSSNTSTTPDGKDSKVIRITPTGVHMNGKIMVVINNMKNKTDVSNSTNTNETGVDQRLTNGELVSRVNGSNPVLSDGNHSVYDLHSETLDLRPKRVSIAIKRSALLKPDVQESDLETSDAEHTKLGYQMYTNEKNDENGNDNSEMLFDERLLDTVAGNRNVEKVKKNVPIYTNENEGMSESFEYGNYSEFLLKDNDKARSKEITSDKLVASLEKGTDESEMINDERDLDPETIRYDPPRNNQPRRIRSNTYTNDNKTKQDLMQLNKMKNVKVMKNNSVEYNSKNISSEFFTENGSQLNANFNTFSVVNEKANLTNPGSNQNGIITVQNFRSKIVKDSIVNSNTTQKLVKKLNRRNNYNMWNKHRADRDKFLKDDDDIQMDIVIVINQ